MSAMENVTRLVSSLRIRKYSDESIAYALRRCAQQIDGKATDFVTLEEASRLFWGGISMTAAHNRAKSMPHVIVGKVTLVHPDDATAWKPKTPGRKTT